MGREWEQDLARLGARPLDTQLVAVGGGLNAGIAARFAGRVKIVGLEPEGSCALHAALEAGRLVDVPVRSGAADSLGARRVGDDAYATPSALCSRTLHRRGTRWAAACAALASGAYVPAQDERVGVLLCDANADLTGFARYRMLPGVLRATPTRTMVRALRERPPAFAALWGVAKW